MTEKTLLQECMDDSTKANLTIFNIKKNGEKLHFNVSQTVFKKFSIQP